LNPEAVLVEAGFEDMGDGWFVHLRQPFHGGDGVFAYAAHPAVGRWFLWKTPLSRTLPNGTPKGPEVCDHVGGIIARVMWESWYPDLTTMSVLGRGWASEGLAKALEEDDGMVPRPKPVKVPC
jgi:hypothetical protein